MKCLRNNIAYGSGADEWFNNLATNEKDTYEHLTDAFEKQWPLTTAPKASKEERIQALKDWVLKPEDLGKKVDSPGGSQVWSHIKWASGLTSRARDAEDTTGFLIGEVYNALPRPIRELIRKERRSTYPELVAAVFTIDTNDLKEAAADFACDEEMARLARQPASPTKAIREALNMTHLQTPQRQYQTPPPATYNARIQAAVPPNPFTGPGGRGNLFGPPRGSPFPFRGAGPGALGMGRGTTRTPVPSAVLQNRPAAERHQDMI